MLNGSSGQAWAQSDGWELSTANPRTGAYHLRLATSASGFMRRVFGTQLTAAFFGQAHYFSELPTEEPIIGATLRQGICLASFRDQANAHQVSFWLGTDGSIVAYRRGEMLPFPANDEFSGTLLGRTDPVIGAGAYQHIEFKVVAGNGTDGGRHHGGHGGLEGGPAGCLQKYPAHVVSQRSL